MSLLTMYENNGICNTRCLDIFIVIEGRVYLAHGSRGLESVMSRPVNRSCQSSGANVSFLLAILQIP